MIFPHISDALKTPAIVHLRDNLYLARFESMKIYSTLAAVKELLARGQIGPQDTLLDSSSGIYAYALALACHKYGLRCHIIASKTVDPTLKLQLELMGAVVEPAASAPNLKMDQQNRVKRIEEILRTRPDVHWMQQYHDDIHYLGYREFAELLAGDFNTEKITLVGGVGSGCSTGATASFLRAMNIDTTLHGVQPFGSVTFNSQHVDDPDIIIAGIGSAIPFRNVHYDLYDFIHWISFSHSRSGSVELLKNYGVFAGLSAGSCHTVAHWCRQLDPDQPCVFIAADLGYRYLHAVYEQYRESAGVASLQPTMIQSFDEMHLHWCCMHWQRRCDPGAAPGRVATAIQATAPAV
ncbi:pyridoxal-phosphate dependent enzyme [Exilibacterium tricleocarpae]|uniref:cysteine synthase n=1 Tax=Exilibacterium tricleocarpae TaxID=2591008 RepID=A0A545T030_9GAMM|nr:pyridoxal-phosphate dependent enzyme [Exilibacterium tricleocarpae]TQV70575.1 pyridoxal-phosphate dependent enzyme [Exilibacterium tricleocarpae]